MCIGNINASSNTLFCFFNGPATTESYTYRQPLSLHDALPISAARPNVGMSLPESREGGGIGDRAKAGSERHAAGRKRCAIDSRPCWRRCSRSEEHTSELQSLMRISYAVFCLKQQTLSSNPVKI